MLRILGSSNPFGNPCDRREVMRIGALSGGALTLPQLLSHEAVPAADPPSDPTFGAGQKCPADLSAGGSVSL